MIKLYGVIRSRSNRPHWGLEEMEVPYEFYQLDFSKGDNRSEFYLGINPSGKMPALQDGDLVLTESGAICNYLAEKFPEKGMIPPSGTPERALYDEWMFFLQTELEQPLWTKGKHTFALKEEVRVPAVINTTIYEFKRAAKVAAKRLGDKEFLVGNNITMVDIVLAHTLKWAVAFEFPVDHENLLAFLKRMEDRPAYKRLKDTKTLEIPRG